MKRITALTLLLILASASRAASDDLAARANAAYAAEDWSRAAELYAELADSDPDNLVTWLRLARARTQSGDFDGAEQALAEARAQNAEHPYVATFTAVNLYARGDPAAAFERLDAAVENGLTPQLMTSHPALAAMRADERFSAAVESAARIAHPCEHEPQYQAFLFWVGDWDVYSSPERLGPAGRNVITRDMKGCMIRERWGMVNGAEATGESYNFYDPVSKTWRQLWLDNSGGIVRYEGNYSDGAMRMEGTNVSAKGVVKRARVTWTPIDGGVHHVIKHFDDDKQEWAVAFDGYYYPREYPRERADTDPAAAPGS